MQRFASSRIALAGMVLALVLTAAGAQAQDKTEAATRHYAATVALQNRELFDVAAEEWVKFIEQFPQDPRVSRAHHYLGVCYLKQNKLDLAAQEFDTVLKNYPQFEMVDATLLYSGVVQYKQGQAGQTPMFDKASATFERLIRDYSKGKYLAQGIFYRGESLYARGKKPEAVAMYQEFVEKFPKDDLVPDALYALGVTQEELNQTKEAGQTYERFLKDYPKHRLAVEVGMRRGETLFAQDDFAGAEKWFATAAVAPEFPLADHATLRQAASLAHLEQHERAAELYASIPEKFPQSRYVGLAILSAGKSLYLAGKYEPARAMLQRALKPGDPSAPEAAHWIAQSWMKEKRPADALSVVEQALPGAGQSPFAAQLLMDQADAVYEIPDRRAEAKGLYAALAGKYPEDPAAPQALYMAAFVALEQRDFEGATQAAADFFKRYPQSDLAPDVTYVSAEANLQLQKLPDAEKLYAELVDKYPQHRDVPAWKVRRALAMNLQEKHGDVVTLLEPLVAQISDPATLAEAQFLLGSSQLELGKAAEAVKAFEASLAAKPDWDQSDDALLGLAQAHRQLNDLDKARATVEQLLADQPGSDVLDRAHYRLGEYLYAAGDMEKAAGEYQQVVDKYPQSSFVPNALYGLGWARLSRNDFAGAEQAFTQLIDQFGSHELVPRTRYSRGMARQQQGQFAAAVEDVNALLTANPTPAERSDARYVLGLSQVGLKQYDQAVGTFRTLLTEDPKYSNGDKVLYELAWALKSTDKPAEAADTFQRLADEYPSSTLAAESLYHVGEYKYDQEQFRDAIAMYREVIKRAGKTTLSEKSAHKAGWAYFRVDDFNNAQRMFNFQRTTWPDGLLASDGLFMEAESLFKTKQYKEALAAYEQVKNPTGTDFGVLTLLHGAQSAAQLGQWDKSLEWLERAAKEHAESEYLPEVLYETAWARQNQDRLDDALKLYGDVIAKTNREVAARAQFMIGEIQFQQKNHTEAVKSFFKVIYGYSYPKWQEEAIYEAARCFEVLEKKPQAIEQYQELLTKFPNSAKAAEAKARIAELQK